MTEFQKTILTHYKQNKRDFLWRETTDPYKILVSEIMLQQTQTERVISKYEQWLSSFPTAKDVAKASLSEVLSHWSGLGYNRRARFLQDACKILSEDESYPSTAEEWDALPGIGPYTARAVMTFAYNSPEVFIETNIRSVFIFFFFSDATEKVDDKLLLPIIERELYTENPREWYYALMDYGAELKKKVKNPNRKSAQYAKQSKFEGSVRQARGAILRCLTQQNALRLSEISKIEEIEYERLDTAAQLLCAEGFIYKKDDVYRICE